MASPEKPEEMILRFNYSREFSKLCMNLFAWRL